MIQNWRTKLQDEAGQVVIIFALSVIPIFALAGFAIDFQHTIKKKHKAQVVLDSAVLAAARVKQTGASDSDVKLALNNFMAAQMDPVETGLQCNPVVVSVSSAEDLITARVSCSQTTSLTKVIGHDKMDFSVESTAEYGIDKLDVAFMFDVSGSMNSRSRLTNLKSAAKDAIDVLLPPEAPAELIEDTRLAMVSYNTMVNAGDYFEAVTGVPATRTYTHVIDSGSAGAKPKQGRLLDDIEVHLIDADGTQKISTIGDGAVIPIEDWNSKDRTDRKLSIDVAVPSSSSLHRRFKSMRLELSGREKQKQTENYEPYALYGDRKGRYDGRNWREGEYELRIRIYDQQKARGKKLYDERIDFEIVRSEEAGPVEKELTLTSTCVWERDGAQMFSDAAPGGGAYLAHRQAWFEEDSDHPDGGVWQTGHPNRPDGGWYTGTECRASEPVGLTNDRTSLINHVNSLNAGGGPAGHLGVAWSWYLVSEYWGGVFTGSEAPLAYAEPDSDKVVILMTDGSFNAEIFPEQGKSDAQARALCDRMKTAGVKVYTVALNAPSSGQNVLRYCSSGTEYFFEPETADELSDAYKKIATSISDLRISQ